VRSALTRDLLAARGRQRLVCGALAVALLAACGDDASTPPDGGVPREQVALVPVTANRDLDVLFVLDDSPGGLELQTAWKAAFPSFLNELMHRHPLPNLHLGVVSTDLGSQGADDAAPGPSIGNGPGSCSGTGKNGALLTNSSQLVTGTFISDVQNSDGTRTTNYTGALADAFATISSLGASGCGFEQPIEAMKRALDNHPANVGFLRPAAALAVIVLTDEDDCSFAHSTLLGPDTQTLGPLQSFRCTQFGIACDVGGMTPDEMASVGEKSGCHWNEQSEYLTTRARYEAFLTTLKTDPREELFAAIAGPPTWVEVELRTAPGGGTPISALAHSCKYNGENGPQVADPAVRIEDLARTVPRGRFESVCSLDLNAAAFGIAREIDGMLGDTCLTRDIALPADCEVADQTATGETVLPPCSAGTTTDCYRLVEDPACTTSSHLRVEVTRSAAPAADTMVAVRCRLDG
jgi:hypothetical protein